MTGNQALIGTVLAERWEVLDELGRGGMGAVYRARHVHLGTDVAIKVLQNTARLDASEIARFYRESRLIGSLHHDHIVRVQDTGKTPSGDLYFVMEHLRGPNLRALLKRDGPLPWARTRAIVLQVCDALDAMHDRGVIHRDLKPQNIVLDPRPGRPDFVKLLDFGVAKPIGEDRQELTQAGVLLGTLPYMAPEYLCGADPDRRIDIYALGVIAFELLTGQLPAANTAANAVTLQKIGLTSAARDIVLRALAREPTVRFDEARGVAAALSALPEDSPVDGDETTTVRVRSRAPELASTAKAVPPLPSPPPPPSTTETAPRPAPPLPSSPDHAQAVTRREGDPVGVLDADAESSPTVMARPPAPRLPGATIAAPIIARPEDASVFVYSAHPSSGAAQELDDPTQIKDPRGPAAAVPLPLREGPRIARADDSPDLPRPGAHESAPRASMSIDSATVPGLVRTGGARRRIAAVVFGIGGLGLLAALWTLWSSYAAGEAAPEAARPGDSALLTSGSPSSLATSPSEPAPASTAANPRTTHEAPSEPTPPEPEPPASAEPGTQPTQPPAQPPMVEPEPTGADTRRTVTRGKGRGAEPPPPASRTPPEKTVPTNPATPGSPPAIDEEPPAAPAPVSKTMKTMAGRIAGKIRSECKISVLSSLDRAEYQIVFHVDTKTGAILDVEPNGPHVPLDEDKCVEKLARSLVGSFEGATDLQAKFSYSYTVKQ
ncbi:serine/threonine protein kinase [Nannocystis pusilla]|uniref:Protein kinase n=1 Tax=Nannocystis pusilla TaxID=889268 RepID=A0ABS7U2U7_9BACT|nr:serine/threonine-protein kinase [Nannocystis pusilla]MBZ5714852.1 protein kinase [Nannocystis pusilla]